MIGLRQTKNLVWSFTEYFFVLHFCLFFFSLFTSTFESILHWGLSAASLAPPWEGTGISLDLILERRLKEGLLGPALVEKWLFQDSIQRIQCSMYLLIEFFWHQKVVVKVVTTPRFSSRLSSRLFPRLSLMLLSRLSLKLSSMSWELKCCTSSQSSLYEAVKWNLAALLLIRFNLCNNSMRNVNFLCFCSSYVIFLFLNFISGLCAIVQRM